MVFSIDDVYFQWDDSLKGKNVIVADSLYSLKEKVEAGSTGYTHVTWSDELLYFIDEDGSRWHYAYPIDRFYVILSPQGNEFVYITEQLGYYVFAVFDSADEAEHWCIEHDKFAEIAQAWLDGKQIQFRRSGRAVDWSPAPSPCWGLEYEYRVKPASEDFKIGRIYRNEKTGRTAMCVAMDDDDPLPVCLGTTWVNDLVNWHVVE